jgi:rhamnosyltransferase
VTIQHNPENRGIAFALNTGVAIAKKYGYTWVVSLDDDTTVDLRMVERLIFYLRQIDGDSPVGLIGMSWTQSEACEQPREVIQDRPWTEVCYIITSGTLFSLTTYDNIGPFRDEFIIGFVDYDYCLRARAKGYRVLKVSETGFKHVLGNPTASRLFGKTIFVRNCNAERHYYLERNSTILLREYFWLDVKCGLIVLLHQIRTLAKILLLEEQKLNKMRSMWRGMIDGLHGRVGRMKHKN